LELRVSVGNFGKVGVADFISGSATLLAFLGCEPGLKFKFKLNCVEPPPNLL